MPGFELSRFAEKGASAKELATMTCFICQDVYCNPMVTRCCKQIFCESCIKSYVVANPICPLDSKPLRIDDMDPPPDELAQKLNNKKIKCSFASKGCMEIVTVENIENHEKYCIYNMGVCKVCNFVDSANHQCVQSLAEFKQNMINIMDKLQKDLEEINAVNVNLQMQVNNYKKTIKDLTLDQTRKLETSNSNTKRNKRVTIPVNNNNELIAEARKFINQPVIDGKRTKKDMVEKVVEITKIAIQTKQRIYEVANYIKEYLDSNYMGDWSVAIWYLSIGHIYYNCASDGLIDIKFGKVSVTIFKTCDPLGFNRLANNIKSGSLRKFDIAKSGFDESATNEIEKLVQECLNSSSDMNVFTEKVSKELMINYGGVWYCLLYRTNFGYFCVRAEKDRYCLLSYCDMKVLIYQ